MSQYVNYLETIKIPRSFEHPDKFQFRKDKKYHRLQKLLFWALNKIGAYYNDSEIMYEHKTIDTNNMVEAIVSQNKHILEFYHQHGERLLIGARDLSELMNAPEIRQMLSFNANYYYYSTDGERQIFGLNVTIIPWMEGMLVIPKGII